MFKVTTSGSRLRVRSGPGLNFAVLGSLANGQTVNVLETRGDWARIGPGWWSHRGYMKNVGASSAAVAGAVATAAPPASPAAQAGLSDILYDAINAFKYSRTGLGRNDPGGDEQYKKRYQKLARQTIDKLWRLRTANEIGFAKLPSNRYGDAQRGRAGADIRVNDFMEPDVSDYGSQKNQEKLAFSSLVMVHEALHLVANITYVNEEVLCRRMQCMYFLDLFVPRRYKSKVTDDYEVVKIRDGGQPELKKIYTEYMDRMSADNRGRMIDHVVNLQEYRSNLEPDFIRRSIQWWGGIQNRELRTLAAYINVLAKEKDGRDAVLFLDMLDQFPSPQSWQSQSQLIDSGTVDGIKESIRNSSVHLDSWVAAIEHRLGINLT